MKVTIKQQKALDELVDIRDISIDITMPVARKPLKMGGCKSMCYLINSSLKYC